MESHGSSTVVAGRQDVCYVCGLRAGLKIEVRACTCTCCDVAICVCDMILLFVFC